MPIYMYKCTECENRFEIRQRFSDDPISECPVCEGSVRRVINSVGVVFKGSGFYVTDNRNGKSNGSVSGSSKTTEKKPSSKENSSSNEKSKEKSSDVTVKKGKSDSATSSSATAS